MFLKCSLEGAIMASVKQFLQVGIVLLLLLAFFGVLLTPDPSDDPAGDMVRLDKSRLLVTSLIAPAVPRPPIRLSFQIMFSITKVPATIPKRHRTCTRLC